MQQVQSGLFTPDSQSALFLASLKSDKPVISALIDKGAKKGYLPLLKRYN